MRRQRQPLSNEELELMAQKAQEMGMTLESLGGDKEYLRYRMGNPHLKNRSFNQVVAEDALATALLVWSIIQSPQGQDEVSPG